MPMPGRVSERAAGRIREMAEERGVSVARVVEDLVLSVTVTESPRPPSGDAGRATEGIENAGSTDLAARRKALATEMDKITRRTPEEAEVERAAMRRAIADEVVGGEHEPVPVERKRDRQGRMLCGACERPIAWSDTEGAYLHG